MATFEQALNVLYALRDTAWDQYDYHLSTYRQHGISAALIDAKAEKAAFDTLSRAIDMVLRVVGESEEAPARAADSDAAHDAYVLASAGYGTDEDYGSYGGGWDE